MNKATFCCWFLAIVAPTATLADQQTMHPDTDTGTFVAIRAQLGAGETIRAISFAGGAAIERVFLAADSGTNRLPQPGHILRAVGDVSIGQGLGQVVFEPYPAGRGAVLWAVVQLSDPRILHDESYSEEIVGWVETPTRDLRSFFWSEGSINELLGARFDIRLHGDLSDNADLGKPGPSQYGRDRALEYPRIPVGTSIKSKGYSVSQVGVLLMFDIEKSERVNLHIFDVRGRRVGSVANQWFEPGINQVLWNGQSDSGSRASAGVYFATLSTGTQATTMKVVVLPR